MGPVEFICEIGRVAYERGLVSGTEGNLSLLRDDGRVLCTASGACKGRLTPDDVCEVDLAGTQVGGTRRPSSEVLLHLEIYAAGLGLAAAPRLSDAIPAIDALAERVARSRVRAVVHTHAPFATTFAVLGEAPPQGLVAEGELFLGRVPMIPFEMPGTRAVGVAVRPHVADCVSAILQNHGAVTWGHDLEQAFIRTETLEAVCRTIYQARLIGTPRPIPPARLAELRAAREKYKA